MVKVIIGLKGSGKTKQLISLISEASNGESGRIVCIERGRKLIYDLSHDVRLIDCSQEDFSGYTGLKGFICGLHAGNYDISHIFIDSLYKVAESDDPDEAEAFLDFLESYGKKHGIQFTVTISADIRKTSAGVAKYNQA